jgi:hypothetical protein
MDGGDRSDAMMNTLPDMQPSWSALVTLSSLAAAASPGLVLATSSPSSSVRLTPSKKKKDGDHGKVLHQYGARKRPLYHPPSLIL